MPSDEQKLITRIFRQAESVIPGLPEWSCSLYFYSKSDVQGAKVS